MDHLPKHPYRQPLPGRSAALSVSKGAIVTAWRALLSARLHTHEASKDAARSGTRVDGEHRPSNRGERAAVTTQGYLAHAFGERSLALQTSLEQLEAMGLGPRDEVVIGAVLTLEIDEGAPQIIALLPGGDATVLDIDGQKVTILSAASPLARQLRDAEVEDVLEVEIGPKVCEVYLTSIG